METVLKDLRYTHPSDPQRSGVFRHCRPDSRHRHRCQHSHFQPRQRAPAAAVAFSRFRSARVDREQRRKSAADRRRRWPIESFRPHVARAHVRRVADAQHDVRGCRRLLCFLQLRQREAHDGRRIGTSRRRRRDVHVLQHAGCAAGARPSVPRRGMSAERPAGGAHQPSALGAPLQRRRRYRGPGHHVERSTGDDRRSDAGVVRFRIGVRARHTRGHLVAISDRRVP